MARLVYRDQHGRERSVEIGPHRARVTIGRNADCVIQTNNASVSREHAVVVFQNGRFCVQDPPPGPPTNGTYVNGQRMRPGDVAPLQEGDELRCGNFVIALNADESMQVAPSAPSMGSWTPAPGQRPPAATAPASPMVGAPPPAGGTPYPSAYSYPANPYPGAAVAPPYAAGAPTPSPSSYAAPSYAPPQVSGLGSDDVEELKRENYSLKAVELRLREQLDQHQQALLDKERLLADLERRGEHHDNVVEGLNDRIAKLKEQVDLQKEQLRTYRDELKDAHDRNEDIEFKLASLQNALTSNNTATASAETQIADLKVQINQRDRRIEDLQREIDLTQYAITTERENVERLEHTLQQVNTQLEDFERYRTDMRKVVEQHEATIAELRHVVDERDRELRRLQDALRMMERGGAGQMADELRQQVESFRSELQRRERENESLVQQLREAERAAGRASDPQELAMLRQQIKLLETELEDVRGGGGDGDSGRRDLVRQLNELKREKRDLRLALDEARAGGGAKGDSGAERRVMELERELDELRRQLREVPRAAASRGGGGDLEALKQRATDVYQGINDVVSQWRNDMQTLEDHVQDLQRLFAGYKRMDHSGLSASDRGRIEALLQEIDPKVTFEEIGLLIDNNQNAAGSIKSSLRELREVLL